MNRFPWPRAILALVLLAFAVAGLSRISFDVDILKLLPTHLRQVEGLSLFLKHFAQRDELIITVEAPTAVAAEKAADGIAAQLGRMPDQVTRAVARPPWETQPAQLAEIVAFLLLNQPPEAVRASVAKLSPEEAPKTAQAAIDNLTDSVSPQEIALRSYDPFDLAGPLASSVLAGASQQSEFASADGTFHVVYVQAARSFKNYRDAGAWIEGIHRAAAPWETGGVRLGFTGEPAFVATISASTQQDMTSSGIVTMIVIALIFWLCYRRAKPLLELQSMLVIIFALTLAFAGLVFSELTVIGVGCAAIMIGLSVDYGYFIFQRSQHHEGSVADLQRQCLQYIMWTSGTTAAAFFALNASSLPGLSQLGNLVGAGVIVGAIVMVTIFAPLAMRRRRLEGALPPGPAQRVVQSPAFRRVGAWVTGAAVLATLSALAFKGMPPVDFSAKTMRPRVNSANDAMDRLYAKLTNESEMVSLVVRGGSVDAVLTRLRAADAALKKARERGEVKSFQTALPIWPDAANQQANLPVVAPLAAQAPRLEAVLREAGFKDEAFALTGAVLRQWAAWSAQPTPIWPSNEASRWIFRRVAARAGNDWLALGAVTPAPNRDQDVANAISGDGVYLVSWALLGEELRHTIPREFIHVIVGLAVMVIALLALAFRSVRSVGLFVATTLLVLACLAGTLSLLGLRWNFFNLASLLLLLGTGTDYSILFLLALKRNGGDVDAAHRELTLVICLCATSAAAGFGTISWANNAGLASLGETCALGLVLDAAISVFLLPLAYEWLHRPRGQSAASLGA